AERHDAGGAQCGLDTPKVEVLERALGEVLPLGNAIERRAALDQHAADIVQAERDAKREADRTAADNDDLRVLQKARPLWHEVRMIRRRVAIASSLVAALLFVSGVAAQAQSSSGIMRIIVPFAPGGINDTAARLLQPYLEKALGQTVIVDNRPGASGIVGT